MTDALDTQLWTPSKFTPPLPGNEDLASSGGHWLIQFVEKYVRLKSGKPVRLADYEKSILIRALETYPPDWPVKNLRGKLRYRTFLLSVARRNHKTSLASYMALYALIRHGRGSSAVLVAPALHQAQVAYDYVYTAVNESPALSKRIKPSKSRGVTLRDGSGFIRILTGDSDALQGHGILNGLFILDEGHLMDPSIYGAAKASMRSVADGMVLILSTAGDVNSTLYKGMLQQADNAIAGNDERFGAIILEGSEDAPLDDVESIKAANPAIDAGYFDLAEALSEARDPGIRDSDKRRYLHNVQIDTVDEAWVPTEDWKRCKGGGVSEKQELTFSFDVTPGWGHGSISVARKVGEVVETQLIASLVNPNLEQVKRIADGIAARYSMPVFAMDPYVLGDLAKYLKTYYEVVSIARDGNQRAASYVYSAIRNNRVRHGGNELIDNQMRSAKTKAVGEGFRIVRGTDDIDGVMSMVYAVYVAGTHERRGLGV